MYIAACWGHQWISKAICLGSISLTRRPFWGPSHLALVLPSPLKFHEQTGETLIWVESSTLIPRQCVFAQRQVVGLQAHRVQDRVQDYRPGRVQFYRMNPPYQLTEGTERLLTEIIFYEAFKNYPNTSKSLVKRILFKGQHAPLCSEFILDVFNWLGISKPTTKTWYSPGDFLRDHLRRHVIIPM